MNYSTLELKAEREFKTIVKLEPLDKIAEGDYLSLGVNRYCSPLYHQVTTVDNPNMGHVYNYSRYADFFRLVPIEEEEVPDDSTVQVSS